MFAGQLTGESLILPPQSRHAQSRSRVPDVAGPIVSEQRRERVRWNRTYPLFERLTVAAEEMLCEQRDVFRALTERRHRDSEDIQPIVPESARNVHGSDGLGEVRVRRGNHAYIDRQRLRAAKLAGPRALGSTRRSAAWPETGMLPISSSRIVPRQLA